MPTEWALFAHLVGIYKALNPEGFFAIESQGKLLAIEVKATSNPGYNDAKGLRTFLQEYGDDVLGGVLLYNGERTFWISEGVLAAPWWKII